MLQYLAYSICNRPLAQSGHMVQITHAGAQVAQWITIDKLSGTLAVTCHAPLIYFSIK